MTAPASAYTRPIRYRNFTIWISLTGSGDYLAEVTNAAGVTLHTTAPHTPDTDTGGAMRAQLAALADAQAWVNEHPAG